MTREISALFAGAMVLAGPAQAQDEAELWRLFVADHDSGKITALDLTAPDNRWEFEVEGAARLYPTATGRGVVAVQSDDDAVSFLASGFSLEAHGDHADIDVGAPSLIEGELTGPRPFHVVTHGDNTAINFDRGGYATFHEEHDLLEGSLEGETFEQATAHHGFSVPWQGRVVSSVASTDPVEGDNLPPRVGLQVFSADGEPVGEMQSCTDLHGEAFSGAVMLAGCAEGVAMVSAEGDELVTGMLPYPGDLPDGSTGTLLGSRSMQVFLGNYGDSGVVVIDPTAEPYFSYVELPYRRVDFILDPARPQHGYILTEDGTLHRLNMLDATIEDSATVSAPYSMDGHWRDPRPRLAMAGDRIVLTDPNEGLVRVLDVETLEETATIPVEGVPYNVISVGGSGLVH
ncbi:metallochaperone AztD [Pelagovum pacificum]|uniref:Zinc transport system substrate-binding protein n=1 Tax=Pelagovum pacificum TaxID=2588711 RepID=A0A5C5GF79_9RHOB|nr:metallochaperone AztD [Pelagovum pacificum]QQA44257.1 metallochaperone AztD [Pelagovum pacificum]TNY32621.1 hypothetical protein FHY64_04895 [Pelagovum pacificum]